MSWPRRDRRPQAPSPPLATPLSDVDPATLDVIEIDGRGRLTEISRRNDDDGPREVPYAAGARDPGSLAGVWEGLAHS